MSVIMSQVIGHHARCESKRESLVYELDQAYMIISEVIRPHVISLFGTLSIAESENAFEGTFLSDIYDEYTDVISKFRLQYQSDVAMFLSDAAVVLDDYDHNNVIGELQQLGNETVESIQELAEGAFAAYMEEAENAAV